MGCQATTTRQLAIAGGVTLMSAINHADEKSRCDCTTFEIYHPRATNQDPRSLHGKLRRL
jgi:hypothetical protein